MFANTFFVAKCFREILWRSKQRYFNWMLLMNMILFKKKRLLFRPRDCPFSNFNDYNCMTNGLLHNRLFTFATSLLNRYQLKIKSVWVIFLLFRLLMYTSWPFQGMNSTCFIWSAPIVNKNVQNTHYFWTTRNSECIAKSKQIRPRRRMVIELIRLQDGEQPTHAWRMCICVCSNAHKFIDDVNIHYT